MRVPLSLKLLMLAGTLALPLATPAFAGQAENNYLAQFEGSWKGRGQMTGPNAGPVACRISFKMSGGSKLNYNGRCTGGGAGAASFRGTVAYNDSTGRYETVGSSQGGSSSSSGRRRGNAIVFNAPRSKTQYGTVSSTMSMSPSAIKMSFTLVDPEGATTKSSVSMTKG